jgi:gas vesicle protein
MLFLNKEKSAFQSGRLNFHISFCGNTKFLYEQFARKEGENMNTKNQEMEYTDQSGHGKSLLTGLFIGGLVGAGTILLLAPQPGAKTRAELQQGVDQLRARTSETVNEKFTQVKSKANQIKDDVETKAEELQQQGKNVIAKQLDRISQAAESGKKAVQNS